MTEKDADTILQIKKGLTFGQGDEKKRAQTAGPKTKKGNKKRVEEGGSF